MGIVWNAAREVPSDVFILLFFMLNTSLPGIRVPTIACSSRVLSDYRATSISFSSSTTFWGCSMPTLGLLDEKTVLYSQNQVGWQQHISSKATILRSASKSITRLTAIGFSDWVVFISPAKREVGRERGFLRVRSFWTPDVKMSTLRDARG